MRFTLNLDNKLVFTPADVSIPSTNEISECLYDGEAYIGDYNTLREKHNFIEQWDSLIASFAYVIKEELGYELDQIPSYDNYENLFDRLKEGVIDSVLNCNDGLLQNKYKKVFCDLKLFIEAICIYAATHSGEKYIHGLLKNLYEKLELCGPGLFIHFKQAFYELHYPADNLFCWMADYREMILTALAEKHCDDNQIKYIFYVHVYTAFSKRARENNWHPLQENKNIDDMLIGIAISGERKDAIYLEFENDFKRKYATETVGHLGER